MMKSAYQGINSSMCLGQSAPFMPKRSDLPGCFLSVMAVK